MKKITIIFIICDLTISVFLMTFYTSSFKKIFDDNYYLSYVLYGSEILENKVLVENYEGITSEIIDTSNSFLEIEKTFDDEIDEQILIHDDNELYKRIDLKIGKHKAYLIAIYDPSMVHIMTCHAFKTPNNSGKDNVLKMVENHNAIVGINGGAFVESGGYGYDLPKGYVIKDGKMIWNSHNNKSDIIGMSFDNKLMLVHATGPEAIEKGMRDGLEFGPFLIVDGKIQKVASYAGGYSEASRAAIGQRADGTILFLVTEGIHGNGTTMQELADILYKYGAINAANLDGGTSTQLVINNELINTPYNIKGYVITGGRKIVTGWGVVPN